MNTKDKDLGLSYEDAMHGVQSAIKFRMDHLVNHQVDTSFVSPKHLRVGIDSSHISHLGIANLLIDKGVFTLEEYREYIRLAANAELYDYMILYGAKFV